MLAFTNTKVTKAQLIASLEAHAAADRIVKGYYWENGKGCDMGCSLHDFAPGREDCHELFEELFGIPQSIAHLRDAIFEGLPNYLAKDWPLRVTRATREGSDLSRVTPRFLIRVIERRRAALADLKIRDDLHSQVDAAMGLCLDFLADWAATGVRDEAKADAAWSAADAARSAAWSAAWRAADAAGSAAWSAALSVADVVWSVVGSAAWSAVYAALSDEWSWMADALIAELEAA